MVSSRSFNKHLGRAFPSKAIGLGLFVAKLFRITKSTRESSSLKGDARRWFVDFAPAVGSQWRKSTFPILNFS